MGNLRKLFFVAALFSAFVGASFQPAHAQSAWRAFCASKGGTAVSNPGPSCFVDGVDIFG